MEAMIAVGFIAMLVIGLIFVVRFRMIIHKIGMDIFKSECQALVNPVNCVGVMGKGLAAQFKDKFPDYYDDYQTTCFNGKMKVGKVHVYRRIEDYYPSYIFSFPTKEHWQGKSKIDYIISGMANLLVKVLDHDIESIAIPAIGSGLGGLDWYREVLPVVINIAQSIDDRKVMLYGPY